MSSQSQQIFVPHVGEGVHYVKVTKILKKSGEWVDEDTGLVEIETDKTLLEMPSPISGYVGDIYCNPGDRVAVGEKLLIVQLEQAGVSHPESPANMQKRKRDSVQITKDDALTNDLITTLPKSQIDLIHQMQRSKNMVIQANIEFPIDWDVIDNLRSSFRVQVNSVVPSSLELIFWSVSQAMFSFPKFRSKLREDLHLEMTKDACIGKAIAAEEDAILTPVLAVPKGADIQMVVSGLRKAVQNESSKRENSYHSLVISDMSSLGVMRANPVVIYPAMATLFVGKPYFVMTESGKRKMSNLVLAFDHRAINGAYAAKFIKEIEKNLIRLRRANTVNGVS